MPGLRRQGVRALQADRVDRSPRLRHVHPAVFEAVGYDADRLALRLYGVEDIRMFYENDLRFLTQVAL